MRALLVYTVLWVQTYHLPVKRKSDVHKCNIYLGKLCAQMNMFTWEKIVCANEPHSFKTVRKCAATTQSCYDH